MKSEIRAEQRSTICFSCQSAQHLLSRRKEVMAGGLIRQDSSPGSALINTISTQAGSSPANQITFHWMSVNAKLGNSFKAGWDKLTSLRPLRANHASRLSFSHRLTYHSGCRLYLSPKMVVNLLYPEVRLCFEILV